MSKPKVAFYWGASCGGCEVAVLDTNETLLDIGAAVEIVLWPIATDGKYADIEALADGDLAACFFNGGVRNSETEHIAKMLRAKSKVLISVGACACSGGIPGLANQYSRDDMMDRVYRTSETAEENAAVPLTQSSMPEGILTLPEMQERVRPLDEVITVDYYLPGCPPTSEWVVKAVNAVLTGELPPVGSVIGETRSLCSECSRTHNKDRRIERFRRPYEVIPEPGICLLDQGLICCGPATRAGCGARCPEVNMGCRGCYGPPPDVKDQGAAMMNATASLICTDNAEEIDRIVAELTDMLGTFSSFTLPKSIIPAARRPQ